MDEDELIKGGIQKTDCVLYQSALRLPTFKFLVLIHQFVMRYQRKRWNNS